MKLTERHRVLPSWTQLFGTILPVYVSHWSHSLLFGSFQFFNLLFLKKTTETSTTKKKRVNEFLSSHQSFCLQEAGVGGRSLTSNSDPTWWPQTRVTSSGSSGDEGPSLS